ncbi:transcriptional regulator [Nitrospira sp. KM1]|uniref:AraC family transcriptional regulator n=1 Tax=Nitrospira sp. KM1 TaxID=1936990 RepID=UPI0013A7B1DC|nr:AraC family transcriptional regulator [Nitrospira sp. KM1]BCA53056.1 transcriptional regulator [Nitrospira sp. KM1]
MLRRVGIPTQALLDPDAWLSRDLFLALINALSSATGDVHCGVHIAEMDSILKLGVMGEAILDAPTLRAAIDVVCRRTALIQTGTAIHLSEGRKRARLGYRMLGRMRENPRQYHEGVLMFLHKILALTGEHAAIDVSFEHSRFGPSSELERVFNGRLTFDSEDNALIFDRDLLELPLQSSTTAARELLPERPSEEEIVRAVLTAVSDQLAHEAPTLKTTATALGLHIRTLERRLARWGVSFESLLDEFRRNRSLQLVHQGTHTLTDIAFLLGYSDSAHFTRAFRRWTGRPPRDYARGLRVSLEFNRSNPDLDIVYTCPVFTASAAK